LGFLLALPAGTAIIPCNVNRMGGRVVKDEIVALCDMHC
jgi:hypothetical protein